jgi:hypothetical protein
MENPEYVCAGPNKGTTVGQCGQLGEYVAAVRGTWARFDRSCAVRGAAVCHAVCCAFTRPRSLTDGLRCWPPMVLVLVAVVTAVAANPLQLSADPPRRVML